jgi:protein TonB
MTTTGRRWMIAFALALAAHTAVFYYAGAWLVGAPRPPALDVATGGEPMELMLVVEAPPMEASSPAVPAPPVVEEPREVRIEPPPPEKPPEPVKEPELVPIVMPEPKPVLTEPEPEVPVAPPVAAKAEDMVDKMDVIDKMDKPEQAATAAPSAPAVSAGSAAEEVGAPKPDSLSSGLAGGPAPISTIHPRYPMGSRIRGEEGPVLLRARVDIRGRPVEVEVLQSSGFFALDAAAVKAVKGAHFVPPGAGAPPESYLAELTIRFQLKDQ